MEIISGPQPASTPSVQAQACSGVRLELKRNIPDLAWVDGAWWPRTTDLTAELPPLLTALFDRVGTAAMVGYQLNAWNFAEPHLDTVFWSSARTDSGSPCSSFPRGPGTPPPWARCKR
jgi:hypothetical protein